ncbi:MAG: hypothetical protein Q8P18_13850 [Pseudomonadota bacterium]|nr:hypothetical protein [Pseudomonadota bacterium]
MSVDPYGFSDSVASAAPLATAPDGTPPNAALTRWATIITVPLVTLIFGLAYYLSRSNRYLFAMDQGIDPASLSTLGTLGGFGGLVAGAALAAAAGGASAMTAGVVAFILGTALQTFGGFEAGVVVVAIGRYMFNVGAAATLARGPRREGTRVAMFMLVYVALNLGAMASRPFSWIGDAFGPSATVVIATLFAVAALVPAVPLLILHLLRPPESAAQLAEGLEPRALIGAAITAGIALLAYTAWSCGIEMQWRLSGDSYVFNSFLFTWINPLAVIVTGSVCAAVVGGLGMAGIRVPALAVAGVGALIVGAGLLPSVFGGLFAGAAPMYLTQLLSGMGEPLLYAGIQARIVAGVHWRVAPIGAAVLPACGLIATLLGKLLESDALVGTFAAAAGVVTLAGGVALCAGAIFDRSGPAKLAPEDATAV